MRKWEKKCKTLCREIVMKYTFCERCGCPGLRLEQHHGLLKSSQQYKLNPFTWHDPTLQYCLCDDCHKYNPDAPHVSQDAFEAEMYLVDPEKVDRLQAVKQGLLLPAIDARIIDWEMVHVNLVRHGRVIGNEIIAGL